MVIISKDPSEIGNTHSFLTSFAQYQLPLLLFDKLHQLNPVRSTMKLQVLLTIAFNAFACTEAFGSFNFGTKAPKSAISKEAIEAALVIYDEKVGSKIKGSGNTSKYANKGFC